MGDQEWAKRVRAAAAYSGLGLAELAGKLDMSDSTLRRHLAATKRPHEILALTQTVAGITQLPHEFFTVDFAELAAGPAERQLEREVAHLRDLVYELRDAIVKLHEDAPVDPLEQDARAAGRSVSGAAADLMDTYARDDAAAGDTRDEADASQEAPEARREGKRSGA